MTVPFVAPASDQETTLPGTIFDSPIRSFALEARIHDFRFDPGG
jgi:hypothetical protein